MSESEQDRNQRKIDKALDYSRVYADGVNLQINSEVCRLIFYQNELEIDQDGKRLLSKTPTMLLRFEVRIPRLALYVLSGQIENDRVFRKSIGDITRQSETSEVVKAWGDLTDEADSVVLSSEDTNVGEVRQSSIQDKFDELDVRSKRAANRK